MDEQQQPQTHLIPECNMDKLREEIAKLNRKARKIGVPELEVVEHGHEHRTDQRAVAGFTESMGRPPSKEEIKLLPKLKWTEIEIVGAGPVVAGYRFIGKLDHCTVPGSVLVCTVPGESIPASYWHAEPVCDHCDTQRYRKDTFVFLHEETGAMKQVGRSCLKDFFGHDPEQLARMLESIWRFTASLGDEEGWGGLGYAKPQYDVDDVLELAVALIRTFGWVSGARARNEDIQSTASQIFSLYHPPKPSEGRGEELRRWKEWKASIQFDAERDKAEAAAARAWLRKQESSNEYMHNLQSLDTVDYIEGKSLGMWASLVSAYQRAMDTLKEAARRNNINEHWGQIKKRDFAEVECTKVIRLEANEWGERTLYQMLTKEGHTLVWFASGCGKLEKGQTYLVKATVKDHSEYNNWAQTIVTRVSVEEVLGN